MQTTKPCTAQEAASRWSQGAPFPDLKVSLLTGGVDRPYAYGLTMALLKKNVEVDVLGSEFIDSPEMHTTPNLTFFNLWPRKGLQRLGKGGKVLRTLQHYSSLLSYSAHAKPKIFHILWNSKIQLFDRTLLMLYYKSLGKKITLTAHNVNQARRDGKDSYLNRITLKIQYHLTDHIFVHTQRMKNELVKEFNIAKQRVTVIRHPLNDAFPDTDLTAAAARQRLGIREDEKALLCFGRIKPYKGVEHILEAIKQVATSDSSYRLIVAGEVQKGNESYLNSLKQIAERELGTGQVLFKTHFIPDEEMETYFKAADVLVLPYIDIFQSGVLFLGYSFGLPIIATDVGSFREEIIEGETGYICRPSDPSDLAAVIQKYFVSSLYRDAESRRQKIREHAQLHHSWAAVADLTRNVYADLVRSNPA